MTRARPRVHVPKSLREHSGLRVKRVKRVNARSPDLFALFALSAHLLIMKTIALQAVHQSLDLPTGQHQHQAEAPAPSDLIFAAMATKQVVNVGSGEPVRRRLQHPIDFFRQRIARAGAEDDASAHWFQYMYARG